MILKEFLTKRTYISVATDDAGGYMGMALVDSIPAETAQDGAIIILPSPIWQPATSYMTG